MCPLTTDRQAATVADALVAADLDFSFDVLLNLSSQVTFDLVVGFDKTPDLGDFVVGHGADPCVGIDASLGTYLLRSGQTDAVDVGQRDLEPLVTRNVDT